MTKTYTETLAILAAAATEDLKSATPLEVAHLESLTDGDGPYAPEDAPTVKDLIEYARRTAGACEHAFALSAALESLVQS